jgi:hypothetical protein
MPIDPILALFKPDFVFSLTFLVGFLGFGYFINNSFFPWFKEFMAHRLEVEELRQKRWDALIQVISDFRQELGAFRETHAIIMAYIISDLDNEERKGENDRPETASERALRKRQSTQDILLRKIQGQ